MSKILSIRINQGKEQSRGMTKNNLIHSEALLEHFLVFNVHFGINLQRTQKYNLISFSSSIRPIDKNAFQRINFFTSAIYSAVCNSIMCSEVARCR